MKFNKIIPHLVAIVLMLVVAVGVFAPTVFDNKVLPQHDNFQARGMQGEINPVAKEEAGRIPLWTNQVFVGMPTFQLVNPSRSNLLVGFGYYALRFAQPVDNPVIMLLLMMVMVYIALLLLEVDYKIAAVSAAAFGLMTSNLLFIEAGHSVKMYALAFVPPIFASAIAAFRGKWILGCSLFGLFLGLNLASNHVQITYYTFFVLAVIGVGYFISLLKEKKLGQFAKAALGLVVASGLAVGTSTSLLWTTYEYAAESTRGTSDLASKAGQSGLDKDYALGLSFEKKEALTLMMPYFYGGSQTQEDALVGKGKKTETQKYLNQAGRNPQTAAELQKVPEQLLQRVVGGYWGSQTMVGGPIYFGVVLCLLFLMGLVLVRGVLKWVLALGFGVLMVLAWGKFFPLTDFLFDNFPMYNKFRDVKMTLLVGQCIVVFMGALALKELLNFDIKKHENSLSAKILKALKRPVDAPNFVLLGGGITALLCLFGLLFSFVGTPATPYDAEVAALAPDLIEATYADRSAVIRNDAFVSLVFVLLTTGLMWFVAKQLKTKNEEDAIVLEHEKTPAKTASSSMTHWMLLGGVFLFAAVDLLRVDTAYVNKDSFKTRKEARDVPKSPEDEVIAKINANKPKHETHYRVLDYRYGSPSQNAMGGYYHKIVGGYHAAKPRLFQDLVDRYPELDRNPNVFLTKTPQIAEMLNVRYVLVGQPQPVPFNGCGNAWFVNNIQWVEGADAELDALATLNPRQMAVVNKKDEAKLTGIPATIDSAATITLTSYHPEKMVYESQSTVESFAVFSEMYYPPHRGWRVFIDGQEVEGGFIKTNYLLRGLRVPAGKHNIEMRFEPKSFYTGETISLISSVLVLLIAAGGLFLHFKPKKQQD